MFDEDGHLKDIRDLDEGVRRAIASVEVTTKQDEHGNTVTVTRIRLCDKLRALDALSRHLGLFEEGNKNKWPYAELSDLERVNRLAALFERARARRDGRVIDTEPVSISSFPILQFST